MPSCTRFLSRRQYTNNTQRLHLSLFLSFFLSFSLSLSTFEKWKSINVEFSSEEIQAQQHPEYFSSENTFHSFLSPWYIANILKTF